MNPHFISALEHYPVAFGESPRSPVKDTGYCDILPDARYEAFFREAMAYIEDLRATAVHASGWEADHARRELDLFFSPVPGVFAFRQQNDSSIWLIKPHLSRYHFRLVVTEVDNDDDVRIVRSHLDPLRMQEINANPHEYGAYHSYVNFYYLRGGLVPIFLRHYPLTDFTPQLPEPLPLIGGDTP